MKGLLYAIEGGKREHEQSARPVRGDVRAPARPRPRARVYARGVDSHPAGRRRADPVLSHESTDAGAGYSRVHPTDPGWRRNSLYASQAPRPAVVADDSG